MIDKERIKAEAEAFFEWPSKDKAYVTTTSMLIFAATIAEMSRTEEREACLATVQGVMVTDHGLNTWKRCVSAIEKRSNAKVSGAGTASAGLPGYTAGDNTE